MFGLVPHRRPRKYLLPPGIVFHVSIALGR